MQLAAKAISPINVYQNDYFHQNDFGPNVCGADMLRWHCATA